MRLILSILVVAGPSIFSMSSYGDNLPGTAICAQMKEAGNRLLAGQPDDFFFIETAGIEFPVPSFFLVASPAATDDNVIKIESYPSIAVSTPARTRHSKNWCNWDLVAKIGTIDKMYQMTGGEEGFEADIVELYQAGGMRVALRDPMPGMSKKMVVAWNDDGFIMFLTEKPGQVYWLIRLAAKLADGE